MGIRVPTPEEARKNGKKGGEAAARTYRKRKMFREVFQSLLGKKMDAQCYEDLAKSIVGLEPRMSYEEAIAMAQVYKAMKGDTAAAKWISEITGEFKNQVQVEQEKPFQIEIQVVE